MLQLCIVIVELERNLLRRSSSDDAVQGDQLEQRECDSHLTGDPISRGKLRSAARRIVGVAIYHPKNTDWIYTRLSGTPLFEEMTILPVKRHARRSMHADGSQIERRIPGSRKPTTDVARHVLVSTRSSDGHARNTLYRHAHGAHLPPWRRYDKCSSTHFGRNESLSLKLLECHHDCTPGKAVLCCQISRGRQSCSRFQSTINNC